MDFEPIETQEQFDAAIKSRLAREREKARAEFADYEELKARAERAEELQEQLDAAAAERAERERAEEVERLRAKVSEETGVPASLIAGEDEESMAAFAKGVADFARPSAPVVSSSGAFAQKASERSEMSEFVSKLLGDSE